MIYTLNPWQVFDSTKLKTFQECARKWFFEHRVGWRSEKPSVHLIWGEAIHKGLDYCYTHSWHPLARRTAIELAKNYFDENFGSMEDTSPKDSLHIEQVINDYYNLYYSQDKFEVIATEIGFAMQVGDYDYYGRIDLVARDPYSGDIFAHDFKTASRMPSMIGLNQWQLSPQFAGYIKALQLKYPDDHVRGLTVDLIVPYKPADKRTGLIRTEVRLTPEQMEEWEEETINLIGQIDQGSNSFYPTSSHWREPVNTLRSYYPRNPQSCTNYNSLCPFFDICSAHTNPLPLVEEEIVPIGLTKHYWNPIFKDGKEFWDLRPSLEEEK